MCFTKRRQKSRRIRLRFGQLTKLREDLCKKYNYSRFFLEIMLFMEESLKKDISTSIPVCSCSNSNSYVHKRFQFAFQSCQTNQKLEYYARTLEVCENPINLSELEKIKKKSFRISICNFFSWSSPEPASLQEIKMVTQSQTFDLRKYLVRRSHSGIQNSYVLESIFSVEPQKTRFSFEQTPQLIENIEAFLEMSNFSYKLTVETWARQVEHLASKPPSSVIKKIQKKQSKKIEMEQMRKDILLEVLKRMKVSKSQEQNKQAKAEQRQKCSKYRFTQQSFIQEQSQIENIKIKNKKNVNQRINNIAKTLSSKVDEDSEARKIKTSLSLNQQEPMARNQTNILKILFPGFDLNKIASFQNMHEIQKINKSESLILSLYKDSNQNRIKARVKLFNHIPKNICLGILNFVDYPQWSTLALKSEIKGKLMSSNSMIIEMHMKDYPFPFPFLVHICEYHEDYLIGIKAYEENEKKFKKIISNFFSEAIIKISPQKSNTQIIYQVFYEKNADFSLSFVKSIINLSAFARTIEGKEKLKQHLKFGWKIDKDMENEHVQNDRRSNQYSYKSDEFNVEQISRKDDLVSRDSFHTIENQVKEMKKNKKN